MYVSKEANEVLKKRKKKKKALIGKREEGE